MLKEKDTGKLEFIIKLYAESCRSQPVDHRIGDSQATAPYISGVGLEFDVARAISQPSTSWTA